VAATAAADQVAQAPTPADTPTATVAPASAPAVSTAAAPATPTVSAATPSAQSAAIEALVHLSRTRGHSTARLALAPEQLGGIQVTLIFGQDGVTARLIAERPEAAAALQRAGQDLKDSLQQQGVDLARLETGFAGDQGRDRSGRQAGAAGGGGQPGSSGGRHSGDGAKDGASQTLHIALDEQPAIQPLVPGRLVDLRA
jgi:flagellar hook-length control protein FliK